MAKSKIINANEKISKTVVGTYQKIENKVVDTYKKVENGFVDRYLTKDGETVEDAKIRIEQEQKLREIENANRVLNSYK